MINGRDRMNREEPLFDRINYRLFQHQMTHIRLWDNYALATC